MNMQNMEFPATETMKGTDPSSHFLVIAKSKDLKLGIRPLAAPIKDSDGTTWFSMGFRLRVEKAGPNGSTKLSSDVFGIEGFQVKPQGHASVVGMAKVISMPCSPSDAYEIWQDGQVTQKIVDEIVGKVQGAGADLVVSVEQIQEYLNNGYSDVIPNDKPKTPEEFKIDYIQ